ncbi:MAG: hypothetical protein AMXMBFR83_21880 [Phycisphaerae bacterium]
MDYWLVKTEPDAFSYDDLARDRLATWDGVTNNWALQFLRRMKKGDRVLEYHTGDEKRVVGIAEVVKGPYPDPRAGDEKLTVVDLKPVRKLPRPVTLAAIRQDPRFADFELVKFSRLSVMPVSPQHWAWLLNMSATP